MALTQLKPTIVKIMVPVSAIQSVGKSRALRRGLLHTAAWLAMLLTGSLLWGQGCSPPAAPPQPADITYTSDDHTQKVISLLAGESKSNPYKELDRHFSGLVVPPSLFALNPFVLGLSTDSPVPTILLLEAHWVKSYGEAGWLFELERSGLFIKDKLVPAVAAAFTGSQAGTSDRREEALMAVPTSIRGNVLFFRRDLLTRYDLAPPSHWDELEAICRTILPREKHLKYGLLMHARGFIDDFYPIFWGFGGRVMEGDQFVLAQPQNQAAFLAALKEIQSLQRTILPAARDMKQFQSEGALQQSFFQGEALFMINWNTRLKDLSAWLSQNEGKGAGSLTDLNQAGVTPIPSQAGQPRRYTNLDSLGWAVNITPATGWNALQVVKGVKQFLQLVASERFQLQAAETWGEVPSLRGALEKVKNREVLEAYNNAFAMADLVLQVRPPRQRVNEVLGKYVEEALYGRQTPEAALQGALQELERLTVVR